MYTLIISLQKNSKKLLISHSHYKSKECWWEHSCHYLFKSIACTCDDRNVSDYLVGLVFTLWWYRWVVTNLLHIRLLLLRILRTRKSSILHLLIKDLDIIIIIIILPDTDFIHGWLEIYSNVYIKRTEVFYDLFIDISWTIAFS